MTSDYGEFADAAELARVAMLAFVEMGDDTGTGKALVSRGIFLRRGGDARGAIRCLRSALVKLPNNERHNRFACHLSMGLAHVDSGDLRPAEHHAEEAASIGAPGPGLVRLQRLRARIEKRRGNYDKAIERYREVAEALTETPADAALVGAELAQVYLQADRLEDAIETARGLGTLAMPWRANRVVSSAIRDLWCSAAAGEMTIGALDRIIVRIRRSRDQRAVASRSWPADRGC